MFSDMTIFVTSCSTCAQSKVPQYLPAGKLLPLPTLQHPWSHLANSWLTDLPESEDKKIVLVTDCFSHAIRLIHLPSLPSAFELAETLLHQVLRYFRIPEDMMSDRDPQFISQVWNNIMEKWRTTICLRQMSMSKESTKRFANFKNILCH